MKQLLSCMALGIKKRQLYPPVVRDFCITLRNISPVAYRFVRKAVENNLPHCKTIISWHANSDIKCEPGILSYSLNLLKLRASEMKQCGKQMIGGILMDEMSGKVHLKFTEKGLVGLTNMPGIAKTEAQIGSEYLVFMFTAINDCIRIPIAYYFVTKSVTALEKKDMLQNIIEALVECGIQLVSVTFDGLITNPAMCRSFGANLNVFSDTFKPIFKISNQNIRSMLDFSHAIKLIRNSLGTKKIFFDEHGNTIEWKFFKRLLKYKDDRNFALCHKITEAHIQWE